MDATLHIGIVAESDLAEKILDALSQSAVEIGSVLQIDLSPLDDDDESDADERRLRFKQKAVPRQSPQDTDWAALDYLLFAGGIEQAEYLAQAAESDCVVLDLTGVCATLPGVPVVVPSVNDGDLSDLRQTRVVSLPSPPVSQAALTLAPLLQQGTPEQVFVTTLLSAASAGNGQVATLAGQTARLLNGIPLDETDQRLAFDVFPQPADKLSIQLQKIFPSLNQVIFHAVQVPVFYGTAQKLTALWAYGSHENTIAPPVHSWIERHENIITPVQNAERENQTDTATLHLSDFTAWDQGVTCWTVADEQRFSIAFLAVKLLESVYQQGY